MLRLLLVCLSTGLVLQGSCLLAGEAITQIRANGEPYKHNMVISPGDFALEFYTGGRLWGAKMVQNGVVIKEVTGIKDPRLSYRGLKQGDLRIALRALGEPDQNLSFKVRTVLPPPAPEVDCSGIPVSWTEGDALHLVPVVGGTVEKYRWMLGTAVLAETSDLVVPAADISWNGQQLSYEASGPGGRASCTVVLSITPLPDGVAAAGGPTSITLREGESGVLEGAIVGGGAARVRSSGFFFGTQLLTTSSSWHIIGATKADEGIYQFEVVGLHGSVSRVPFEVQVISRPTIDCGACQVVGNSDEPVALQVTTSGADTTAWFRLPDRTTVIGTGNSISVPAVAAEFLAEAKGPGGTSSVVISVSVSGSPPSPPCVSAVSPQTVTVPAGTTVTFASAVTCGTPAPALSWRFQNQSLAETRPILTLTATEATAGIYTFTALNSAGSASVDFHLSVKSPPPCDEERPEVHFFGLTYGGEADLEAAEITVVSSASLSRIEILALPSSAFLIAPPDGREPLEQLPEIRSFLDATAVCSDAPGLGESIGRIENSASGATAIPLQVGSEGPLFLVARCTTPTGKMFLGEDLLLLNFYLPTPLSILSEGGHVRLEWRPRPGISLWESQDGHQWAPSARDGATRGIVPLRDTNSVALFRLLPPPNQNTQ